MQFLKEKRKNIIKNLEGGKPSSPTNRFPNTPPQSNQGSTEQPER
jgi:hypothetical protein